ncbi:MAG: CRISPR-associated endonuclease Cas2 [Rubrobacteraceae bacterium]|jgi:CRISPR-associated protein Cas2|nr:CRISPR-associated endonuclease Cas2 [Rubrobacteraceae bacterium]
MHVLMVYDVNVKRVTKVLKIGRKYLQHIQNSVLEGELSPAQFKSLRNEIKKTIKPEEDCVRFYLLRTTQYLTIDQLGTPQKPAANPETSVDFL